MGKKINITEAKERLSEHTEVVLCEDSFVGWKKKSKFFDKVAKKYFWSIPADVYRLHTVHPDRRLAKKKQTNVKKYGVEYATQLQKVKEKTKKTNLRKYGKEYYLQTEDKKQKTKKTNQEKYGHDHHMQLKENKEINRKKFKEKYGVDNPQKVATFRKKTINTIRKRYKVDNISQLTEIQDKKRSTSMKNWGVAHPLSSTKVRNKAKETIRERYGVDHPMKSLQIKQKLKETNKTRHQVEHWSKTNKFKLQIKKKKVLETGQWVRDWLLQQSEPKPAISTINQIFAQKHQVSTSELLNYLSEYRSAKTILEKNAELIFETKHFNKKPKKIRILVRPDFKLSPSVFVNVDGLYWHSEAQKNKWYHFKLREEFERVGLRIFQFREDEIRDKSQIVKSVTNNALGKTKNRTWARKCKVLPVEQYKANPFLENNHLMGPTKAKHIGLFHEDILVSLLSYKQTKNICKIERFCSLLNMTVSGGFSKLLSHLERNYLKSRISQIHNWVDLRYGTGNHLYSKGFVLTRETLGWKWTDGKNTFNRLQCRANMDGRKLTQKEYSEELGWVKIYDAGQRLFQKEIPPRNK